MKEYSKYYIQNRLRGVPSAISHDLFIGRNSDGYVKEEVPTRSTTKEPIKVLYEISTSNPFSDGYHFFDTLDEIKQFVSENLDVIISDYQRSIDAYAPIIANNNPNAAKNLVLDYKHQIKKYEKIKLTLSDIVLV